MSDRDALIYFYQYTQGHSQGWKVQTNWDTEKRCAVWHGVTIDEGAHVKSIVLCDNRLTTFVPLPESTRLKALVNLETLFLNSNFIRGPIPDCLKYLESLLQLNLAWNEFEGHIPESIYTLVNLTVLRLDNNRLTGEISPMLGNLKKLKLLNLGNNQLTGEVPKVGAGMHNLGVCDFLPGEWHT